MHDQDSEVLLQGLPKESIAVLRRHNLLKPLLRAQIIENHVIKMNVGSEESERVWENYLIKNQIDDESSLNKHLGIIGLDKQSLRWQP